MQCNHECRGNLYECIYTDSCNHNSSQHNYVKSLQLKFITIEFTIHNSKDELQGCMLISITADVANLLNYWFIYVYSRFKFAMVMHVCLWLYNYSYLLCLAGLAFYSPPTIMHLLEIYSLFQGIHSHFSVFHSFY